MRRADTLEKNLMLRKIEGKRRKVRQRMRWLDGIINTMDVSCEQTPGGSEGQGSLPYCSPWGCKESDMTKRLNNKKRSIKLNFKY